MRLVPRQRETAGLVVAVTMNVAAGVIVYLLTRSAVSALAAIVVLEAVGLGLLYTRQRRRPHFAGIVRTAQEFALGPNPVQLARSVSTEFVFWGISAKSLLSNDDFRDVLLQKSKGTCEFRFLLLDPHSEHVAGKAAEEGDTATSWKSEIQANIDRLQMLQDVHHLNIRVRLYDTHPNLRLFFINGSHLYFGWYPSGRQGVHSPMLVITNTPGSLYSPMRRFFDQLWTESRDPFA